MLIDKNYSEIKRAKTKKELVNDKIVLERKRAKTKKGLANDRNIQVPMLK